MSIESSVRSASGLSGVTATATIPAWKCVSGTNPTMLAAANSSTAAFLVTLLVLLISVPARDALPRHGQIQPAPVPGGGRIARARLPYFLPRRGGRSLTRPPMHHRARKCLSGPPDTAREATETLG